MIEMMIAMLIVAVAFAAMAGATITSLTALNSDEQLVRATALANEMTEHLHGSEWDKTGFYAGDFAPLTPPAGTVLLSGSRSASALPCEQTVPPLPSCTVTRDGVTYDARTEISWVDDASDGTAGSDQDSNTRDYKRFLTTLDWQSRGGSRQMRFEALRAPNARERPAEAFSVLFTMLEPDQVGLDSVNNTNVQQISFEATTTREAAAAYLEYTNRDGTLRQLPMVSSDQRIWTRTILAGEDTFANGETAFTVRATSATGVVRSAQKRALFLHVVQIVSVNVNQSPITVRSNTSRLCGGLAVTVDVRGVTTSDSVSATWNNGGPATAALSPVGPTPDGAQFKIVYPGNDNTHKFTTANNAFSRVTITATRGSDQANAMPASSDHTVSRVSC
ncbi:MAG: hypothetical protein M3415_08935 [Actinomycetota bacterium]|nr:hypothetical protein [Actinomycetota bacterium]